MTAKRWFDLMVSSSLLVLSAPLWPFIALAVRLSSSGPVLHRATRVGRLAVPFTLYKFRSMRVGPATAVPGVTATADPRITGTGAFLRRTKLDELPQLINVVRGDMSVVGPRPEDPRYVAGYTTEQRQLLDVRPGLISPATLRFLREEEVLAQGMSDGRSADEVYVADVLPEKLAIDLEYIAHASVRTDLQVIAGAARRSKR